MGLLRLFKPARRSAQHWAWGAFLFIFCPFALPAVTATPANASVTPHRLTKGAPRKAIQARLSKAADAGNYREIELSLAQGANPNGLSRTEYEFPILLKATLSGCADCVKLLIKSGARPGLRDRQGTPLILTLAAIRPKQPNQEKIWQAITVLIRHSKPSAINATDAAYFGDKRTALHEAAARGDIELAKLLIASGASQLIANRYGELPLHMAVEKGQKQLVSLLLDLGSPVTAKTRFTKASSLTLAAESGHVEIVFLLIERMKKTEPREALKALLESCDTFGRTPAMAAAQGLKAKKLNHAVSSTLNGSQGNRYTEIIELLQKSGRA